MRNLRLAVLALGASLLAAPLAWADGAPGPTYGPSGLQPCLDAITSARVTTCTFTPKAGRGFNVEGSGTFVAGYQLERLLPGETVWKPITAAGTQLYVWTVPASESAEEDEFNAQYRVNVTSYTSGTLNVRISQ